MRLLVGLGNPGATYALNRHNIGFMLIDSIAAYHRASPFRSRFQALISEVTLGGEQIALIKPQTYMNESGLAVGQALRFWKLTPADCLVFHDELDLAPGKLRIKIGGGNAGHNGLRSISAHIGNDYKRIRIGIGHPGLKDLVHRHVLDDFAKSEMPWLKQFRAAVAEAAPLLAQNQDSQFQNQIVLAMKPEK